MSQNQIDTIYLVETPEGIDLQAELAGPVPRILAYAIDLTIRAVILAIVSAILAFADKIGIGIILLLSFFFEWFYPVFFEVLNNGQTIGKKYMGLIVVNDDLTAIGWSSSLIRNLLRAADFLPFSYLGGMLCMMLSSKFQRLGDLAAGSLVIYKQEQEQKQNTDLPKCQSYPPPFPLTLEDQIAIIGFTERHNELSPDRQHELADILSDITHKTYDKNIDYLRGVGSWLLGAR